MKYIKLYEELYDDSEETISRLRELFRKYDISDYEYEDGYIDIHSSVDLSGWELTEIPISIRTVFGNFDCCDNNLTTLKNGPHAAMTFDCSNNKLTSLEGCPDETMDSFFCTRNLLTSLEHSPDYVAGHFNFGYNPIHNFDGLKTQFEYDSVIDFKHTPIANICGIDEVSSEDLKEFRERFEMAVDGKKVKLPMLKYLRHIYSSKAEDLESLVKRNGYEIV